jgi:acetyl-CoA acetyltransferase
VTQHPFASVAIAAVHNTVQARRLEGHDSMSITIEACRGALADAGIPVTEVDGVLSGNPGELAYSLGIGPLHTSRIDGGVSGVLQAAALIATGVCRTVLVADGGAGIYTERAATAPWTRPANEFVLPFGMYTAVEFALIARTHMDRHGTTPEQMATVAATIRNNGHVNPDAVYRGRGPFTPDDILASRMVAEPFHLLDCSMTSEGGTAILLTSVERARDAQCTPVYVLGGGVDHLGPSYSHPPSWDLGSRSTDVVNGYVGRRAARQCFEMSGLRPDDVDVCEFYDPFSFEIIRQFEAFEFCADGEGGPLVESGAIAPGGRWPITTDGGTMSFSHGGGMVQLLQRIVRGVQQLQGTCASSQVPGATVAMCSNGGAGALFTDVILLGSEAP